MKLEKFSNFANFNISPSTLHTKLAKKENFSVLANLNLNLLILQDLTHEIGEEGEFLHLRQFQPSIPNFTHEIGEEGEFLRLRQFQPSIHQLYTRNWRRRRISPSSPISTVDPPTLHTKLAKKENFSVFAKFNRQPPNFTHEIGEEGEFLRFRQIQPSTPQLYTRNWRRRRISPSSPSSPI